MNIISILFSLISLETEARKVFKPKDPRKTKGVTLILNSWREIKITRFINSPLIGDEDFRTYILGPIDDSALRTDPSERKRHLSLTFDLYSKFV